MKKVAKTFFGLDIGHRQKTGNTVDLAMYVFTLKSKLINVKGPNEIHEKCPTCKDIDFLYVFKKIL
jgi:hypothetical protein